MNRKPTKAAKYSFEPKIPQTQDLVELDEMPFETSAPRREKGYPPARTETPMCEPFAFESQDGLLLSLPSVADARLVVYEDGSCGLRVGDSVYPMSFRFIGESLAVEHEDAAYKVGGAKFQLSAQILGDEHKK